MKSAWELVRSLYDDFTLKELEEIFGICTVAGIVNTFSEEYVRDRLRQHKCVELPVHCLCGSVPSVFLNDGEWFVVCPDCGTSTPKTQKREIAVHIWNVMIREGNKNGT